MSRSTGSTFDTAAARGGIAWAILLLVAGLPGGPAGAESAATLDGGQIVRMDYASDGETVGGTFDYRVLTIDTGEGTTGFFNVVADLDRDGKISDAEWIVRNVPLFLDDGLVEQPLLSVWFEPGRFEIVDGESYDTWATLEDAEIEGIFGFDTWHFSSLPATSFLWGGNDPSGQEPVAVTPSTSTLTGKYAKPKRKGVPDIAQKTNECGPTATANSLRWLAAQHGFGDKLPASDDDLIKELMKAMTGSDARPFPGLTGNQLFDGKKKYIADKGLPLVVKGGNTDASASGGKAFDFIAKELDAGEDVEFLIDWPGPGSHWVTAIGHGMNGERRFLEVNDPDDGKTGAVEWELKADGTFVSPKGTMLWAVSESPAPPEPTKPPPPPEDGKLPCSTIVLIVVGLLLLLLLVWWLRRRKGG